MYLNTTPYKLYTHSSDQNKAKKKLNEFLVNRKLIVFSLSIPSNFSNCMSFKVRVPIRSLYVD